MEGHHQGAAVDVAEALDDLESLLGAHASPATLRRAIQNAGTQAFD